MRRCLCSKPGDIPRCTRKKNHAGPHEAVVTWGSEVHAAGEVITWVDAWISPYQPPVLWVMRPEEEFLRDVKLAFDPPEFWKRIRR
jgi:hypothetical protein